MSKEKMPWLKDRLRAVGRTPAGLARHLSIGGPRVYEMIAGRRGMQPGEIEPAAGYLDWSVEELIKHLPETDRNLPANQKGGTAMSPGKGMIPVLATSRTWGTVNWDLVLTGEITRYVETLPALRGRTDIQCLYMANTHMEPWRAGGDLVVYERDRPPRERDYVVIYLQIKDVPKGETRVMVRQLLEYKAGKIHLYQHNAPRGVHPNSYVDRKSIAEIFRVMTWDDVIR
jgi:hypothetical protein